MRIFYFIIIFIFQTFIAFGQQKDFFEEDYWVCTKVILDGEETDFEPIWTDIEDYEGPVLHNYYSDVFEEYYSSILYCDRNCIADIMLMNDEKLQRSSVACLASEGLNNMGEICYAFDLFWEGVEAYTNIDYEIVEGEDYKELIITDQEGNQTFYRNLASLSVDKNELSDLRIYPNPNNGKFVVEGLDRPSSLLLFDMQGRIVFQAAAGQFPYHINLSNRLTEGIYFLEINQNKQKTTKRILVK